ncbi:hypothetical protein [Streptomyces sp. NPDC091268]|uniref:hypothetical protein n=1 Tax=Streptomyces sp. NPDC091268 TaxID=3365979 RepID=UPI003824A9C6
MITETALERTEFTCGRCWHDWSIDYEVQQYRDQEGVWEYFSRDGILVPSPYTPAGASPCPVCGARWVGRLVARRLVPAAPGAAGAPRERVLDGAGHRPERRGAPLLGSTVHPAHTVHTPPQRQTPAADAG